MWRASSPPGDGTFDVDREALVEAVGLAGYDADGVGSGSKFDDVSVEASGARREGTFERGVAHRDVVLPFRWDAQPDADARAAEGGVGAQFAVDVDARVGIPELIDDVSAHRVGVPGQEPDDQGARPPAPGPTRAAPAPRAGRPRP